MEGMTRGELAMQTMLSGLLETPQGDIQNYLRSFRTLDE